MSAPSGGPDARFDPPNRQSGPSYRPPGVHAVGVRRWLRASQMPFARTWAAVVGAILGLLAFLLLPPPSAPSPDDAETAAEGPADGDAPRGGADAGG